MFSVPRKARGGSARCRFGGGKGPNSMGKLSTFGVLRLRAAKPVSRNTSVMRSAQDDDFVGLLMKNINPLGQQTKHRDAVRRAYIHLAIGNHRRNEFIVGEMIPAIRRLIAVI
jgi:hypothetical protein